MQTEEFLKSCVLPLSLAGVLPMMVSGCGSSPAKNEKPNILVILADDYGWMDCSFMGSELYETPNMDRLAARSMVFTDGYAACQVSSPSRASIMTGLYTTRHGVTDWIGEKSGEDWRTMKRCTKLLPADYKWELEEHFTTVAEALKAQGYTTFMAGKWHLGDKVTPEMQGFDVNVGGYEAGSPKGGYFPPYNNPKLEDGPAGEILCERLGRETADFMEEMAEKKQPFFAYLSFYAVHGQIQTTEALWRKYRDKIEKLGFNEGEGFELDRRQIVRKQQDNPVYAGLIEMMDNGIGIALDKLEELGLDKNTIIIFTGDNGGVVSGDSFSSCQAPLRGGKGRQWEGGIRVPYIVHVPGMEEKTVSHVPVSGIDIFPTALDYAGAPASEYKDVDGVSLRNVLEGKDMEERPLFWHYPHYGNQGGEPSSIIRRGDWKLIWYHETGYSELYNLAEDLGERKPLEKVYPEKAAELKAELMDWLEETGAVLPVEDPQYSEEKEQEYLLRTNQRLLKHNESLRRSMMKKEWQPNASWWDSKTID